MSNQPVRVRIAPSPTGNCHVGTARTALYNYLLARKLGGSFILRVDDTDTKRNSLESEQGVFDGLKWIGLTWDEGPDVGGNYGPYRQSERQELYHRYAQQLLDAGLAYECFCTPAELEAERKEQMEHKEDPRYSGRCLHLTDDEKAERRAQGIMPSLRLKVRDGMVGFMDDIRGRVEQDAGLMGDFVIMKSNGIPIYNFATVVDEHEMDITHVIRAAEHIANTYPQILIYEALGWEVPHFAHLVLMLNPDKTKISKRKGAVYLGEFAELGYLPEALLNFCAFLGWSPGGEDAQEIFSLDELVERFSLERCTQSNAVFDTVKLDWMNGMWIRRLSAGNLAPRVMPFMQKAGLVDEANETSLSRLADLIGLIHERLPRLDAAPESLAYFYQDWTLEEVDITLLTANKSQRTPEDIAEILVFALETIQAHSFEGDLHTVAEELEQAFKDHAAAIEWKLGDLLMPLRVSLTNRKVSPPLFAMMVLLGKECSVERISRALTALQG